MEADTNERARQALGSIATDPQVRQWLEEARALRPRRFAPITGALTNIYSVRKLALTALCVIAVLAAVSTFYSRTNIAVYETRAGERRTVELADQSRITLNSRTTVFVRYSRSRRDVELRRGEALFSVTRDNARPFRVSASGITTQSIGTQFDIDLRVSRMTIAVLEGAVRVSMPDALTGEPLMTRTNNATIARVDSGHALRVSFPHGPANAELIDGERVSAWTRGQIDFIDTPLSEAVEEINRYSQREVTIGSSSLASIRVGGIFRTEDPSGFLFMLRESLRIETRERGGKLVLIESIHLNEAKGSHPPR